MRLAGSVPLIILSKELSNYVAVRMSLVYWPLKGTASRRKGRKPRTKRPSAGRQTETATAKLMSKIQHVKQVKHLEQLTSSHLLCNQKRCYTGSKHDARRNWK